MRGRVIAVLALLVAGCGDDGQETGAGADAIPAAEWATRVERLCDESANRGEREVVRLQEKDLPRRQFVARLLERSAELSRPLLDEMAAMPPPEGKQAEARRFVRLLRKALPVFRDSARALRERDAAAAEQANRAMLEIAVPARALARELGVDAACIPGAAG